MAAKFDIFIQEIENALKADLPGKIAQDKMAAASRNFSTSNLKPNSATRKSAVLILFYPGATDHIYFPLIQRPVYNGAHSGQISLPGGKAEQEDKSLIETAVRECEEEIGVPRSQVNIIGQLSELYVFASNFSVLPIVGYCHKRPFFQPDQIEVESVIEAPLLNLLDPNYHKRKTITVRNYQIDAPYFDINKKIVWGATAMILSELSTIIKNNSIHKNISV